MLENIRLSFQGIWSHKMRSLLTMLGIIIGIASIIAIVSTITGTNEQIKENLIGAGNNTVTLQLYHTQTEDYLYDTAYEGLPDGVPVISEEILTELRSIPNAAAVSVYNRRNDYSANLFFRNNSLEGSEIYGIENDFFDTAGYALKKGRLFQPKDFQEYRPVMIVDETVASVLFSGEDPLDKTVEYSGIAFTVVGVVQNAQKFEPVINSEEEYWTYMTDYNSGKVFIPKAVWADVCTFDEPEEVIIQATTTDDMSAVSKEAAEVLNTFNTNSQIKYKGDDLLKQAQDLQNLTKATQQQLIWIAFISLLVGGIGVMNIMLVSVTERTKEIGIKKAIGARKSRILFQFLTEASVLTILGGIIGVIAGVGVAYLISYFTKAPVAISVPWILISVGISMSIGIVFGLLPSIKASNLSPIEALRRE